jgi:hypothetical protein
MFFPTKKPPTVFHEISRLIGDLWKNGVSCSRKFFVHVQLLQTDKNIKLKVDPHHAWKIMENHGKVSFNRWLRLLIMLVLRSSYVLCEFPAVIAPRSGAKLSPAMAVKLTAG